MEERAWDRQALRRLVLERALARRLQASREKKPEPPTEDADKEDA